MEVTARTEATRARHIVASLTRRLWDAPWPSGQLRFVHPGTATRDLVAGVLEAVEHWQAHYPDMSLNLTTRRAGSGRVVARCTLSTWPEYSMDPDLPELTAYAEASIARLPDDEPGDRYVVALVTRRVRGRVDVPAGIRPGELRERVGELLAYWRNRYPDMSLSLESSGGRRRAAIARCTLAPILAEFGGAG